MVNMEFKDEAELTEIKEKAEELKEKSTKASSFLKRALFFKPSEE